MKTVWKYTMPAHCFFNFKVELPASATVVKVAMQGAERAFWATVDTDEDSFDRLFRVFGTGSEIPRYNDEEWEYVYVDTFFEGPFVWHLFELKDLPF